MNCFSFKALIFAGFGVLLSVGLLADQIIISDEGREVLLREDGTWQFLSEDRFGTLKNGTRIRLRSDGRWSVSKNEDEWVSMPARFLKVSKDTLELEGIGFQLSKVVIESERGKNRKNSTLRAQIIAELVIDGPTKKFSLPKKSSLRVTDSRGREYEAKKMSLISERGNTSKVLRIILNGAPRWWGVKFFKFEFNSGAFGHDVPIELTKAMSEVSRLEVDSLSTD
ncbi:MAG: hypothetical protein CMQ40_09375 [Gammaproteobacteria bacterium]|nr:hypothetical protein [Gammaproteobacteria bacterium]